MLGDPHNFGQRVARLGDQIVKPRCLLWEWLFLSGDSPLRQTLERIALRQSTFSPMRAFPRLKFSSDTPAELIRGGCVEFLELRPISPQGSISEYDARMIGAAVATCAWFGLSDLHHENIAFGRSANDELVWGPIDIESAFADFELLSQTLLLPTRGVPHAGLISVIDSVRLSGCIKSITSLCRGYIDAFDFLNSHCDEIYSSINGVIAIDSIPNRLILRPTRQYLSYLNGEASYFFPLMCEAEINQLRRGDVPYFLQFTGQRQVFVVDRNGSLALVDLPNELASHMDIFQCALTKGKPRRVHLRSLVCNGVMQLLRAFDFGQGSRCEIDDLTVAFGDDRIELNSSLIGCLSVRRLLANMVEPRAV